MKKLKKIVSITTISITLMILLTSQIAFAANNDAVLENAEYSEEYLKWLELSDEKKENTIAPRMYEIQNTNIGTISTNPLKIAMSDSSNLPEKYRLDTDGGLNLTVKNQEKMAYCWAFAAISSLETTLAKANPSKQSEYKYSERHMAYATTREFKNGINELGYNRTVSGGGSWWTAEPYLTNGSGAKKYDVMPFVDSDELIEISEIQKGNVATQVYDTIYFPNYINKDNTLNKDIIDKVKEHIKNYGAVFAGMHWNKDIENSKCYNKNTYALFCNNKENHELNHAVSIIGWDDTFKADNFLEGARPKSDGAWIIKNSWGDQVGDKGYMYVSYEDVILSSELYGIIKAKDSVNYDNIYQYNKYQYSRKMNTNTSVGWVCNVFDKKKNEKTEYLNQVSITIPEKCTCKVFVNSNLKSPESSELTTKIITDNNEGFKEIALKDSADGKTKTLDAGYHTLEFESPIKIESEKFAVAVKIEAIGNESACIAIETADEDVMKYSEPKAGQCFYSNDNADFKSGSWRDLGTISKVEQQIPDCISTIKAFITLKEEDTSLKEIKVTSAPSKTEYYVGENFVKTGMKVTAYFNNNTSKVLNDTDYTIENGSNLKLGQKNVTIKYEGISTTQSITVKEKQQEDDNKQDDTKQVDAKQDDNKQDETKQDDTKQDTNQQKNEQAQNSQLENSKSDVKKIKTYYFTDNTNKDYTLVDVEVSGISRNLENDKLEYYYYLSSSKNDKNISNWIKITESQNSNNKLEFTIDSRNVANYNELAKSDVVYLYVKEVAVKGGNQSVAISDAMKLETDKNIEVYENNIKKENTKQDSVNINNSTDTDKSKTDESQTGISNSNKETLKDNTTATGKLPQTGVKITVIFVTVVVLGIGIFLYVRYKNLSKYVN